MNELSLCIMRSSSAAIWVLGCHVVLLALAVVQGVVALWSRFGNDDPYAVVDTSSDSGQEYAQGYDPGPDTRIEVLKEPVRVNSNFIRGIRHLPVRVAA